MKLIDNLEELKKGDFIKIYEKNAKRYEISKIVDLNNKVLQIQTIQKFVYDFKNDKHYIDYNPNEADIIFKNLRNIIKKKLKHKIITYNSEYVVFKLSPEEKSEVIKRSILANL